MQHCVCKEAQALNAFTAQEGETANFDRPSPKTGYVVRTFSMNSCSDCRRIKFNAILCCCFFGGGESVARRGFLFVRRFLLKLPNAFLFNLASMSCFSTLQTNKKKVNFSNIFKLSRYNYSSLLTGIIEKKFSLKRIKNEKWRRIDFAGCMMTVMQWMMCSCVHWQSDIQIYEPKRVWC